MHLFDHTEIDFELPLWFAEIPYHVADAALALLKINIWAEDRSYPIWRINLSIALDRDSTFTLGFTEKLHKDEFIKWFRNFPQIRDEVFVSFDVNDLLDNQDKISLNSVPLSLDRIANMHDFIRANYALVVWYETHIDETEIWFDDRRDCFWFTDPAIATAFKLKFSDGERKTKRDRSRDHLLRDLTRRIHGDEWNRGYKDDYDDEIPF